jgi:hypothetical protein
MDRTTLRALRQAIEISRMANTLTEIMNEELDGMPEVLACLARIHYAVLQGSSPRMTISETDQALAIHKNIVMGWIADERKEKL